MVSDVDRRRLVTMIAAPAVNDLVEMDDDKLRRAYDDLCDAVAASQSLDDLGSFEANEAAMREGLTLGRRLRRVDAEMKRRKARSG
jgi:hypothetical protein